MRPIFVVLCKQGGEVREAEGGGLNVIHGDATTIWHVTHGSFLRRAGVGIRHQAEIRLADLPATLPTLVFKSSIETCGAPLWNDYIVQIGDCVDIVL
jgi:hypothetical protein